jgi:trehalose 6-phosphate phosphatase
VTATELVERLAADAPELGLVADFDGTLATIVDDPAAARAEPAAIEALGALAEHLPLVAVLSGRPVSFLRERVLAPGVRLVGQYGLERLVGGEVHTDPRALRYAPAVAAAAVEAERTWPTLLVERKGVVAATLHWRTVPDDAPPGAAIRALADRHGLVVHGGRRAAELRPPVPVDKGTTLAALLAESGVRHVVFVGDDQGDLAAFDAIDRHVARTAGARGWRVAVTSTEAPAALVARADLVVAGPEGTRALLEALVGAVSPRR